MMSGLLKRSQDLYDLNCIDMVKVQNYQQTLDLCHEFKKFRFQFSADLESQAPLQFSWS